MVQRDIDKSELSQNEWADVHGLSPGTVSDLLNDKAMSLERFNLIRMAMGKTPVGISKPVPYLSRQIRLSPVEAASLDARLAEDGYTSFNDWWHAEGWRLFYWDAP